MSTKNHPTQAPNFLKTLSLIVFSILAFAVIANTVINEHRLLVSHDSYTKESIEAKAHLSPAVPLAVAMVPAATYSASYQAILDYADSLGLNGPVAAEHFYNDSLMKANSAFGWRWDVQYHFNTSANDTFARINYATPGQFNAVLFNNPVFEGKYGFRATGGGNYLKTGYTPASDGVHVTKDSNTIYLMLISDVNGRFAMGSRGAGKDVFFRTNSPSSNVRNNSSNTLSWVDTNYAIGDTLLIAMSRTNGSREKVFVNGVEVASETGSNSPGLSPYEQFIGVVNEGTSVGALAKHNFISIGYGAYIPDDEMDDLYNHLLWRFRAVKKMDSVVSPPGGGNSGSTGDVYYAGIPNLPTNSSKLSVNYSMFLSDYHAEPQQSEALFDGDISTHPAYDNTEYINPGYESIPTTGLTGQCLILDLQGEFLLDSVRILDGSGVGFVGVYTCPEFIFEPDSLVAVSLSEYNSWIEINVQDTARYLIFNNPTGTVNGIGEIEIWGEQLTFEELSDRPVIKKPIEDVWGFTTHDYDHVPSVDSLGLYNIADINFTKIWRTYVETNKTFDTLNILDTINTQTEEAGGLDNNQIELIQAKGGKLFLSFVNTLDSYMATYPSAAQGQSFSQDLPIYEWIDTISDSANEMNQYNPESWGAIRDIYVQVAKYLQLNGYAEDVVLQPLNELDAAWKPDYVRLNAFQIAALWSMLWDGHEGNYGTGIKDVAPDLRLSSLVQAYNNQGYTRRQVLWFQYFRADHNVCWDLLAVNTYCTTKNGFQWAADQQAQPPENTFWIQEIKRQSNYAYSLGKEFMVSEFMADATFHPINKNRVKADNDSVIQADWDYMAATINTDNIVHPAGKAYNEYNPLYHANIYAWDSVFLPKYDSLIHHLAGAWNSRMFLMITPWVDYATGFNIRDQKDLSVGSPYVNRDTYSSSGIAYNRAYELEWPDSRGNLRLKPWGEWFKNELYEQLDGFQMTSFDFANDTLYTVDFVKDGHTKTVYWNPSDNHSRPRLFVEEELVFALISDSLFEKSTEVYTSDNGSTWTGVDSIPDNSTYTLQAVEGQPYSSGNIYAVDSSKVIKTENDITFFRKTFELNAASNLDARFRMSVDAGMEIYVNGTLIAREDNSDSSNFQSPSHDLKYSSDTLEMNGYNGNDSFDYSISSISGVFNTGLNEVVLAVRNKNNTADLGGFSFRLDLESNGSPVMKKSQQTSTYIENISIEKGFLIYPNPTNGKITIELTNSSKLPAEVSIYEAFTGKLLQIENGTDEVELDLTNYASGLYLIRVRVGNKTYSQKVIKH